MRMLRKFTIFMTLLGVLLVSNQSASQLVRPKSCDEVVVPDPPKPKPAPKSDPVPVPESEPTILAGTERSFEIAPGVSMAFVWIPPGEFTMGSPESEAARVEDEKQHQVRISRGFWLGKYEVTQAQYQAVMGSDPSKFTGARNPVEQVSWEDCSGFLRKLGGGYRLPIEAEWECACRAGTRTAYSFGDEASALGSYAWYDDNGDKSHPVGQKKPNPRGLYDMHGNVYEWCSDWHGADHYGQSPSADPTGPSGGKYRVVRGGSWLNYPFNCRAADRAYGTPGYRSSDIGFRVVQTSD